MACFLAATAIECVIAYAGSKGMPYSLTRSAVCDKVAEQVTAHKHCCAGSLFEEQKRKSVPRLIVAHLVLSVCTVAVNLCGTWLLHSNRSVCGGTPQEWKPNSGFAALVWTTWAVLLVFMLFIVTPLQLFPGAIQSDPRSWRFRCAVLACCCCRWRYLQLPCYLRATSMCSPGLESEPETENTEPLLKNTEPLLYLAAPISTKQAGCGASLFGLPCNRDAARYQHGRSYIIHGKAPARQRNAILTACTMCPPPATEMSTGRQVFVKRLHAAGFFKFATSVGRCSMRHGERGGL